MTSLPPSPQPALVLGAPRFADARLAALAQREGPEAAWRAAFEGVADVSSVLERVDGRFALGIELRDGRSVLAVDRFAVHGLCYTVDVGRLRFAERADVLAGDTAALDLQSLFDYLYFHVIPAPRTVFAGVLRLPAGHCAVFAGGRLDVQPYFVPTFSPGPPQTFEALKTEFRTLLSTAVARELGAGKPACFLSGGTDSSTVAGMVGQVAGRPAATYSIGFDAQGYDEMEYARVAARHFGTEHHEYYVTPDDLVASMPAVAASYDQPFGNSSVLPAYYCARMARDDGVDRLLAGDGGDELFGGNTRYAKQTVFGWYGRIPQPLRAGLLEPLAGVGLAQRLPLARKAASYVNQARVPMPDRTMTYNLLSRLGLDTVLTPEMRERVDPDAPLQAQRALWQQARGGDLVDRMLAFDWRLTLADCDLPKVVGSTALAGLGVGFPLLDDDLLRFSQRLPAGFKLNRLRLRWFFKEALRGFLPDEILAKKKQGFGLPFGVWTARHAGLQALARDSLHTLADRGVVRRELADMLLGPKLTEHAGYYGEMVWILTMLEQWLRARRPGWRLG